MDMHQLEVFVSVVANKGFLASAEKLHVSQSTVSRHIACLERELGTELIRRTTRTFELTPVGKQLFAYATDILALRQKATKELSSNSNYSLRIGTSSVPAQCLVPQVLSALHQTSPDIRYEIVRADSMDIIQRVSRGSLDLGFVGTKADVPCVFVPVASDELVLATPNTAPYRKLHACDPQAHDVLKCPFLVREEESGTMKETLRFFAEAGIPADDMNIAARINDAETLRLCIVHGLGVSVVSYKTVEDLVLHKKVLTYSLGERAFFRDLYIVYRRSKYQPERLKKFIRFAVRFCGERMEHLNEKRDGSI